MLVSKSIVNLLVFNAVLSIIFSLHIYLKKFLYCMIEYVRNDR